MTVTSITKDREALSLTVVAEFAASADQVWQLWQDPRLLERWWGPPTFPATVEEHDLTPGGRVTYLMTGPGGEQPRGWWRVVAVDAPHALEFEDGFADDAGNPDATMPVSTCRVTIAEQGGTTTMTLRSTFPSVAAMDELLTMGMAEGILSAVGQCDEVLRAGSALA